MTHEEFEKSIMDKLLFGENEVLKILKKQYQSSTIETREFDGIGFFTYFKTDKKLNLKDNLSFHIGDIYGISKKEREIMLDFILFIRNGAIEHLEGCTFGAKDWITDYDDIELVYDNIIERDLGEYKTIPKDRENLKPILLNKDDKVYISYNNKVAVLKLDIFNIIKIIEQNFKIYDILEIKDKEALIIVSDAELKCIDLNGNIIWDKTTDLIENYYIETENNCIVIKTKKKIQKFSIENGNNIFDKNITYYEELYK